MFLFRNVLCILLGPEFVHFCLGASKAMFSKNLIRLLQPGRQKGANLLPTETLAGDSLQSSLSSTCKKMFSWLSDRVSK